MKTPPIVSTRAILLAALGLVVVPVAFAQVRVIDMIPNAMSDESNRDSEPYLAVNPANPRVMAATAFLLTPLGSPNGPLLVSTDGGSTWETRNIIPSMSGGLNTFDVTIRFNTGGTAFYAALLRDNTVQLEVQRTTDLTFNTALAAVNTPRGTDQPYVNARTATVAPDVGRDRVWVGNNEGAVNPASATVDQSFDVGIATPVFTQARIDVGTPVGRDNYQVRPVSHADGRIYAAFYRRRGGLAGGYNADVVVVRDDDWGRMTPPFSALLDTVTLVAGQNVVAATPVSDTGGSSIPLGREWWGGDLYLTVDPGNSGRVYISYSDSVAGAARTLHLRRSSDAGHTWGSDLLSTASAKNAAIAINSLGTIAYLYQQLAGTSPTLRWQTHLRRSADGVAWDDVILADFPAEGPGSIGGSRIIGDYLNMVAVGKNFYGVFSSSNDLANATFPTGTAWLRNRTPDADPLPRLLGVDGVTTVTPSIDPFFFSVMAPEPQIQVPGSAQLSATCSGGTNRGSLNVCNTGKADLIVTAITSSNPQFAVIPPSSGLPVVISHDFCFPFEVAFQPSVSGPQTGALTIASNDPAHPSTTAQVFGSGTEPDVRVTGSTAFGVASAWRPAEKTLSVCNTGGCSLSVSSASVTCPDFSLVSNPFPASVSPDSCLDLGVEFTPTLPGPRTCGLTIATNDPDTPTVARTLTARTPPFVSFHAGVVDPQGALNSAANLGSTFTLGFVNPFKPRWAWDLRLGHSRFDGGTSLPDTDLWEAQANVKFTVNPAASLRLFVNGGPAIYHFDPGSVEGGFNLGVGLNFPAGRRFAFEATYNYQLALTASPHLKFSQFQLGLVTSF